MYLEKGKIRLTLDPCAVGHFLTLHTSNFFLKNMLDERT